MIAMQRVDSSLATITGNRSVGPGWAIITNKSTGHRYLVSVSITDLDYKQAYKIERTLHNDRRMINAFLSAFATDPSLLQL